MAVSRSDEMLIQALSFPGPQFITSRLPSGSNAGGVVSSPWRSISLPFHLILSAPFLPAKISYTSSFVTGIELFVDGGMSQI
jgi:hypothetical protein